MSISRLLGTQHHRTTAYHPQSNGLVERFHRHLKSALRARLTGPSWTQELPWVLLGIRTVPKEDLGCSSAEMVYGAPLTVPGDFIPSSVSTTSQPSSYLRQLRDQVRGFAPIPTSQHGALHTSFPGTLQQAKFVFIRRDAHRTPLQRPYEGPFKVIQPGMKTFQVDVGGKRETIAVDRLKPAHVSEDNPVKVAMPRRRGRPPHKPAAAAADDTAPSSSVQPRSTRSGRQVKSPQRYISVLGGSGVADTG